MSTVISTDARDALIEQDGFAGFASAGSDAGPNTGIAAVGPGGPGPNTGIAAVGPGPRGSLAQVDRREPTDPVPVLSSIDDLLALR